MKTNKVLMVSKLEIKSNPALKRRILGVSRELFFKHGFARITVDEIASELGISKATVYKYFSSKDELLEAAVEEVKAEIRAGIGAIVADGTTSFLQKLSQLMTHIGSWLSKISPVLARDIRRSMPGIWENIDTFRRENILVNFKALIEAAAEEGIIKSDINRDLILRIYLSLIEKFVNPDVILDSSLSAQEIFETVIRVFFEGILTDKAKKEFSDRKNVSL